MSKTATIKEGRNKGRTVQLPEIEVSHGHEDAAIDAQQSQTLENEVVKGQSLNPEGDDQK